jgi:hypothetical protein
VRQSHSDERKRHLSHLGPNLAGDGPGKRTHDRQVTSAIALLLVDGLRERENVGLREKGEEQGVVLASRIPKHTLFLEQQRTFVAAYSAIEGIGMNALMEETLMMPAKAYFDFLLFSRSLSFSFFTRGKKRLMSSVSTVMLRAMVCRRQQSGEMKKLFERPVEKARPQRPPY